jgi:hypothetical protein
MKWMPIAAMTVALSSSAFAAEPIDFSRHILDLDGKDIPSSGVKDAPPIDLALVAGTALFNEQAADPHAQGQSKDPGEKLARFNLAVKIHESKVVSLSSEEITMLKAAIAQSFGALIYGRAIEILDPVKKP